MSNTEFGSRLIDKALTVITSYENAVCNRHDKHCKLICTIGCIGAKIGQESLLGHRVAMIKWPEGCCVHLYSVTYIQYTHRENFKKFISLKTPPKNISLEALPTTKLKHSSTLNEDRYSNSGQDGLNIQCVWLNILKFCSQRSRLSRKYSRMVMWQTIPHNPSGYRHCTFHD